MLLDKNIWNHIFVCRLLVWRRLSGSYMLTEMIIMIISYSISYNCFENTDFNMK